jgi:hypothetical protein
MMVKRLMRVAGELLLLSWTTRALSTSRGLKDWPAVSMKTSQ